MASVDIVVPCYNYAHFLEGCVSSVLSQRDVEVRVLILDDASPDNTAEIGETLAQSDPRVTYLRNEENLGLIGTANRGLLDWAEADYVLLLSADDLLTPGSLARATSIMEAHADVHMVFGRALLISDDFESSDIPPEDQDAQVQLISGHDFIRRNFTHGNPVPSPAAVLRTRVQKELGGYLPQFAHTSDMEMWMRFAAHGSIGVIKTLQACYRIHDTSMSAPRVNRAISDREERLEACAYAVEHLCQDIPPATDWLTDLKRRFAKEAYWLANQTRYTASERATCVAFARRIDPDGSLSLSYLKFLLKRLVMTARTKEDAPETYERAGLNTSIYGWWPDEAQP